MRVFIFLHILTMFTAVTISYGPQVLILQAASRRDAAALRGVAVAMGRLGALMGPTYLLGALFGVIAIFTNDFNPLAPWLLIAYGLFVLAMLNGALGTGAWLAKVARAAATSNGTLTDELANLLADRGIRVLLTLDVLLVIVLIADMVLKPFS
jgi:hypothetical protein